MSKKQDQDLGHSLSQKFLLMYSIHRVLRSMPLHNFHCLHTMVQNRLLYCLVCTIRTLLFPDNHLYFHRSLQYKDVAFALT